MDRVRRGARAGCAVLTALIVVSLAACASPPAARPAPSAPPGVPPPAGSAAVFLGDSYTVGVGATSADLSWTSIVSAVQGWKQINMGIVATGYVANDLKCGLESCPSYLQRVPEVVREDPAVVVVAGGQNDIGVTSADAERAAITRTYQRLRSALPNSWIIAVGPSYAGDLSKVEPIAADVRAAAEQVDATYVDLLEPDVIQKKWVIADGIHVDDDGHRAIAARVDAAIGQVLHSAPD